MSNYKKQRTFKPVEGFIVAVVSINRLKIILKHTINLFLLFICSNLSFSQPLLVTSQNLLNKFSLSPSCAGLDNNFKTYMSYRQNWLGIQGAPENIFLNLDGAFFDNAGYGISVISEKVGIFKDLAIGGTYAYHVLLDKNQYLSFGLTAQYFRNDIELGNNDIIHEGDPLINYQQYAYTSSYNCSFGTSFMNNGLNTGISASNLLKTKINNNGIEYPVYRQIKAFTSYKYKINNLHHVEPLVIVYVNSDNYTLKYEVIGKYTYMNEFWGGVIYRKGMNIGILAGINLYGTFALNYCYEFSNRAMLGNSSGTHEITIGFLIEKDQRFSIEYIKAKRRHFKQNLKSFFKRK